MSEWNTDEITLQLSNPLTQEDIDLITDVNMERTTKVWFHTPNGNEAEFVKVVRCKDCIYRNGDYCHNNEGFAHAGNFFFVRSDDFCSYGERREE